MKKFAFGFIGAFVLSTSAYAATLADDVLGNLYAMRTAYEAMYAPKEWKKKYANYDLNRSFAEAVAAVNANPRLSLKDSRDIFKNFIYAMRDYHVSIRFDSTESAMLPFTVKNAGDRFFVAYIDRSKLSESSFPFQVGDELIQFGDQPVLEAVKEIEANYTPNVKETDRSLATLWLTGRTAARGMSVPQGPVTLGIKRKGAKTVSEIQLIWTYTPEKILPRADFANAAIAAPAETPGAVRLSLPMMNVNFGDLAAENPFQIGGRKTFTPDLGTKIWETSSDNTFHAYLYMNAERKLIGYVRIFGYIVKDYEKAVKDFAGIISHFETNADAMVIDQVNNPGGSVFYLYALASMLTDQPLKTPLHRMAINQANVKEALDAIKGLENVKTDEEAIKALGFSHASGYPVNYAFAQFILNYARFIVSEWNAGRKLSTPFWIWGADHVNPAKVRYTKPILLLTNELDFSGGDFFPAILQDNKRVTILGTRTAGAGGYVLEVPMLNNVGISSMSLTGSLAERVNKNPIENLGVTPDISYEMTAEDYQGNFGPYVKAIQSTVDQMAK